MARAVFEGVAFSLRHCIQATGIGKLEKLLITSGGAQSPLWREIVSGVLGATIRTSTEDQLGLLGTARLASLKVEDQPSIEPLTQRSDDSETQSLDAKTRATLDASLDRYLASVTALTGQSVATRSI